MRNLCETCIYANWDSFSFHSSKECGLPGSSEQMVFEGCNKIDSISDDVATAIENCEDIEECSEYVGSEDDDT